MRKTGRYVCVFGIISALLAVFSECGRKPKSIDPRGTAYAGANTCRQCHANIDALAAHDPHRRTSSKIAGAAFLDALAPDSTGFRFSPELHVEMEKRGGSLFQVAYFQGREVRAERFDLVFGSGTHAQTFAFWKDRRLFQQPVSWFRTVHNWANSPGFPAKLVYYNRAINSRCIECHASYIDKEAVQTDGLAVGEEYKSGSMIYGIDCERCHGPAADHVEFHLANPVEKKATHITSFKKLGRMARIDQCAVCHSGSDLSAERSTFGFKPGDTLARYFYLGIGARTFGEPDVHGNQAQLMQASKCFMNSKTLECNTCHENHQNARPLVSDYVQKCLSCHAGTAHKPVTGKTSVALTAGCIRCHMPLQPSRAIQVQRQGKTELLPYLLHNHRIAVYKDLVKERAAYEK